MDKSGKSIIKFSSSFRESAKQNLGLSDDEVRQLELEVIKHQRDLREGIATSSKEHQDGCL